MTTNHSTIPCWLIGLGAAGLLALPAAAAHASPSAGQADLRALLGGGIGYYRLGDTDLDMASLNIQFRF